MRCTSVMEVAAPPDIVWELLLNFPRYPKFVGGIAKCEPYKMRRTITGGKVTCATYTAAVGLFKLQYYVEHHFEPLQQSMTWTLDYSRRSDLFDSVGYWHVEAIGKGSRVYYTQDTLLPSWIPATVRSTFTRVAMSAATSKLEPACVDEIRAREKSNKAKGFLGLPKMTPPKLPTLPKLPKMSGFAPLRAQRGGQKS